MFETRECFGFVEKDFLGGWFCRSLKTFVEALNGGRFSPQENFMVHIQRPFVLDDVGHVEYIIRCRVARKHGLKEH